MEKEYWKIFLEIHKDMPRQGSGRDEYTQKAFQMIPKIKHPKILDIGCGPGLQTIKLAKISDGKVIGIDIVQQYLNQLQQLIKKEKLQDKVKAVNQSMTDIQYPEESFDIIWAEGSIFIMGFENGLIDWKKYIKPKGFLAIHEMAWIKKNPPKEIREYWDKVYPEIATIKDNIKIIEKCGYYLLDYFPLPEDAWWEFYYNPLQKRIKTLKKTYQNNPIGMELIEQAEQEIAMFKKYNKWYGSVFYIMKKS
jgi:ubiquinone/menaquinone biosynthesis C-methylase UbiE